MCVFCVYLLYIFKYTHMHVYILEKKIFLYIKYIYLSYNLFGYNIDM